MPHILHSLFLTSFLSNRVGAGYFSTFRHPDYQPNSASLQENRYNPCGVTAYYAASGVDVARAEVPNWEERDLYNISPTTINAFDLASWSHDNGVHEDFLRSKQENGHELCQEISKELTFDHGISGILYNSEPVHTKGQTGYCLAILPQKGKLVGDTFFIGSD